MKYKQVILNYYFQDQRKEVFKKHHKLFLGVFSGGNLEMIGYCYF